MRLSFTLTSCVRACLLSLLCLSVGLSISSYGLSTGELPPGSRRSILLPVGTLPGISHEGPLPRYRFSRLPIATTDPIRFRLRCDKQTVRLGEPVELTITAELLNVSSALLFSLPGANAYRLKLLMPAGFVQTGGDFTDYVGDELAYPSRPLATYHLTGYFTSVPANTAFRLLRSHAQADGQSLFIEKAAIALKTASTATNRLLQELPFAGRSEVTPVLYISSETAPSGARTAAALYVGYLEFATCTVIGGWVADLNSLQESVSLDIYINGAKAATVIANQDRQDVADAKRSASFNKYGFRWAVPESYRRNTPLTFSVRVTGAPVELLFSPRRTDPCPVSGPAQDSCRFAVTTSSINASCGSTVLLQANCQGADCGRVKYTWSGNGLSQTGQSTTLVTPATDGEYSYTVLATLTGCTTQTATATVKVSGCTPPDYRGFLDSVSCDSVRGWGLNRTLIRQSISVDIFIDGRKATTVLASGQRPDVARAFNVSDFNRYGYRFAIPDSLRKATPMTISVRVAGTTFELERSPQKTAGCSGQQPPPAPCSFSVSTASTSITCGNVAVLKADCQGADCGQVQYTWAGEGMSRSGQSVSVVTPATNGTYSYSVTAARTGCASQTAVARVTVSGCTTPAPTPCSFSITAASTSVTCGSSITLKAECLTDDCNQIQYTWTGQGISRSGQSVSFTAPATNGTYSYTVTATRPGCSTQTAVARVTVNGCSSAPVPCSFSISAGSASVRCDSIVTLRADCRGGNCDQVQYVWTGERINLNGQSVSFTPPAANGIYSYSVTATQSGCTQTATASVTVTACNTTPTPCSFSVIAASTSVTCGSSVTLKAECLSDNCDQVQYAWVGPGVSQSGQSISFTAPATNGTYSYTVTATRAGCLPQTAVTTVTVSGCGTTPPAAPCSFTIMAPSTSINCRSSVTLRVYCQGDNCDQVQYAWAGPGLNQTGQTVSFSPPEGNGVYAYTVTATRPGCATVNTVASVTVSGCSSTPVPCSFSIIAASTSVTCGNLATLKAECLSDNCDQVQYAWVGSGVSQSGQSISFTAPATNGTYSYTVTATRAGCSSQTATTTVTVTGCGTTPPDTGGYPILNSPPPADRRPILQNERIRLAIDLGVGGVIREVTDLQVGENMINCMIKDNGLRDPGRDDQISLYSLPSDSQHWTVNGKPVLEDIGYNPVQGGDVAGNFSPILGYGRTNTMLYCKTRGLHWGINNEPGDYVVEQWIRLEGNIVRRHVRITGDRTDQTNYADCRQQELPCTYTNSAYYQYYVVQGEPYTNAPLVNVNTIPNLTGTGPLSRHTGGTNGPYNIDASEPWIVAVRPNTNRGIALHTPYSHEFKVGLFNEIGYGPAESSGAGYIANGMSLILDRNGVYEFDVNMVVGTLGEIRSTVNTLPRSETKPNYVFAGEPTRHGFFYRKGYDQGFPIGNELSITPTDRRFKIVSPHKSYRASETNTLYVRMRARTPETKMILEWRKVGQSELQAAQAGQTITFDVTGDNQYRTIAIPVRNHPLWNGLINTFAIRYVNQTETPVNGHQVGIKWISATDLGDN